MSKTLFTFLFILCSITTQAQKNFKTATEYFNKGEYALADSFYLLHISAFPTDINAQFNRGIAKLYQGDTCTFCRIIQNLYFTYSDAGAKKLHYSLCAAADTVYYLEDLTITSLKKARYSQTTETRKCTDYKVVTVRDKKGSGSIININHSLTKPNEPNVIALYKMYEDGHKIFHYAPQPPEFPGGEDAKWTFLNKNNKHREDAIKELKISNSLVEVTYIIDKDGKASNIMLVDITTDVDKFDKAQVNKLREYVTLIFSEMPRHSPAVFRGERVDYFISESLTFK